jgi:hypothetical protein
MTAKEKHHVRKLEIRIEELERHFNIANSAHCNVFRELFETRAALRQSYEALMEAANILGDLMANDPAFMQMVGRG